MSKASSCKSHLDSLLVLLLVLQVALEPVGQGEMGKEVESVAANAASDALTAQLAQQPRRRYGKETKTDQSQVRKRSLTAHNDKQK